MRPRDEAQRDRRIVRPAAPSQRAAVFRRFQASDEPRGLLGLILLCLRRPTALADVGAGGITDGRVLAQLAGVYVLLALGRSFLSALVQHGFALHAVGLGVVDTFAAVAGLLMAALGLYIVAQFTSTSPGFGAILSGVALVNVISTVLVIAAAVVAAPVLLLAHIGVLPAGAAEWFLFLLGIPLLVLNFIYGVHFLMGLFDFGCVGAVFLGFIASFVGLASGAWIAVVAAKLVGA